jgi:diaminohydroxyphosphoribosylaminopyrimidine deaminase/5-amino-6-(5-phosphoribosylamino)uracil reductase
MASDEDYMRQALELARRGLGRTSPNPAVGALLVKDGKIIGRGYHEKAGENHAEINALDDAGEAANGSTMYVTLEPCRHYGKTPPCVDAIKKAGISRVVMAMRDPNPVAEGGLEELQESGIKTEVGIMEDESKRLNEAYLKYVEKKMPFVIIKSAMSADGKIATKAGESKWLTGDDARRYVHEMRGKVDAVMVGVNTVIKDDPLLTCRAPGGRNPIRVVVDSKLRTPSHAQILNKDAKTIILTTKHAPTPSMTRAESPHVKVLVVDGKDEEVDLKKAMRALAGENITSIMIEGGGEINASALRAGIVDKILFFIAPKIIGGKGSVNIVGGGGVDSIREAIQLENMSITKIGADYLLEAYVKNV